MLVKNSYYIGIDVGGTKISGALISPEGIIAFRKKTPTPKKANVQEIVRTIRCLVKQLIDTSPRKEVSLKGIGLGIPGIVDAKKRKIITTPNLDLSCVALASLLERTFKTKVLLENDVNLGTLGEKHFGAAKQAHHVIGLFPGTGIGGGVIINDVLISGAHGAAGEIGHMVMDIHGPLCGCGRHGCLESLSGRWAIERDIRKAIKQHKKTIIKKLTKNKLATIKSGILKEALKRGDPLTKKIMKEKSEILGLACINLRRLFDPEMIVLGGGLIEACGDFMLPIIKKTVQADLFLKKLKPCAIVPSKLGDDAVLLGAAALFKFVNASS